MSVTPTAHPLFWHRNWKAILEFPKVQSIRTNNSSYASQNMMWRERASVWWTVLSQEIEGFCNQYLLSKWNVEANILAMKVMILKRYKYAEVKNYLWLYLETTRLHSLSSANFIGEVKNILARWEIQSEIDGGQFANVAFRDFVNKYRFARITSIFTAIKPRGRNSRVKITKGSSKLSWTITATTNQPCRKNENANHITSSNLPTRTLNIPTLKS